MAKRWRRSINRMSGIIRTFTFLLSILCFFHIYQANLYATNNVEIARRKKHMLFLAHEQLLNEHKDQQKNHKQNNVEKKLMIVEAKMKDKIQTNDFCKPKTGLVFVKTHKTASTTITNIILRYAAKRQLVVGLPPERRWELGGYPASFDPRIVTPQVKRYDVLCHHMRYDHKHVSRVMPKDTTTLTVLREPSDCFESGFGFFRDWPYSAWFENQTKPGTLEKFVDDPDSYYNRSTPWFFRARNYMAFDLGFDPDRSDVTYAKYAAHKMDEWFGLVLITEKLDESLILLKYLLCMETYDEIIYIRLKVRQPDAKQEVSDELKEKIRKWNSLDTRIYEHFAKKLEDKIDAYGRDRMENELTNFRGLLNKTRKRCVDEYDRRDMKPWVSRIRLKEDADEQCDKLSWGEVKFGDYIREKQLSYTDTLSLHQPTYDEISRMLAEAQKKIIGEEGVRTSA